MSKTTIGSVIPDTTPSIQDLPTIGNRLSAISNAMWLTRAAVKVITTSDLDRDELADAIEEALMNATTEMYFLRQLPGLVLNIPAPDDDEADAFSDTVDSAKNREIVLNLYRQELASRTDGVR